MPKECGGQRLLPPIHPQRNCDTAGFAVVSRMIDQSIDSYHTRLAGDDRAICDLLRAEITSGLSEAESKIWHAHPVWFLAGNPIVGYSKLKNSVRLLFWSGQSFESSSLSPEGSFKAAEARFTAASDVNRVLMQKWLAEARVIQWDYRTLIKRKGKLERLA